MLVNGKNFTCFTVFSKHYHSLGQQVEKSGTVAIILFLFLLLFHQLCELMCQYEHLLPKKKVKLELNILCENDTMTTGEDNFFQNTITP